MRNFTSQTCWLIDSTKVTELNPCITWLVTTIYQPIKNSLTTWVFPCIVSVLEFLFQNNCAVSFCVVDYCVIHLPIHGCVYWLNFFLLINLRMWLWRRGKGKTFTWGKPTNLFYCRLKKRRTPYRRCVHRLRCWSFISRDFSVMQINFLRVMYFF